MGSLVQFVTVLLKGRRTKRAVVDPKCQASWAPEMARQRHSSIHGCLMLSSGIMETSHQFM